MTLVYKIVHAAEWREAERAGSYVGSAKDQADGFLHFSTGEQVPDTLAKYYADATDLILVAANSVRLGAALKFEPAHDGVLFPHLYAALPLAAVAWSKSIERDRDGAFVLPPELEAGRH